MNLLQAVGIATAFAVCMFGDAAAHDMPLILIMLRDRAIQYLLAFCGVYYFAALTWLQYRRSFRDLWRLGNPDFWLLGLVVTGSADVICGVTSGAPTQALFLVTGIVLGRAVGQWLRWPLHSASSGNAIYASLIFYLALLIVGLAHEAVAGLKFQYRGEARWSGMWEGPNIFGLLSGVGLTIAFGLLMQSNHILSREVQTEDGRGHVARLLVETGFYAAVCGYTGFCLFKSYSRGAWVATVVGVGYMATQVFSFPPLRCAPWRTSQFSVFSQWIRKYLLVLVVIILSAGILAFWQFRRTEWNSVRRAFSTVNTDDFSWRNRIAAWEGALQITGEHPWFGAGWNQPEPVYGGYYLPPKVSEGAAIEMNDYLMLGATLGIPALFCFGMYMWLSLARGAGRGARGARSQNKEEGRSQNEECEAAELDWLKTTCRAGAIVLLVGFWFDGGLFKLATASTFWILLELGSVAWGEERRVSE